MAPRAPRGFPSPPDTADRQAAAERIRTVQQGFGRPIISTDFKGKKFVAVGGTLHWGNWKTFSDFLCDYIKQKIGTDWGNAELAKPFEKRHPLIQWYHHLCVYQQAAIPNPGVVTSFVSTGIVGCYLQLAYGLYLLAHNVELQDRLLKRLKNVSNFQGAYYEIAVARLLILSGFTLALEDESDSNSKHCEFSAVSRDGRKYWVEAKMRSVAGMLGKTAADGRASDGDPGKTVIRHLSAALEKPATDTRLIFLDINSKDGIGDGLAAPWHRPIMDQLSDFERNRLKTGQAAYLFVTNMAYHHQLDKPPTSVVAPYGLGLDFEKPGWMTVVDAYRRKQRHLDAYSILETFGTKENKIPSTFDGSLPSETFHGSKRIVVGETYIFEKAGPAGEDAIATVTSATVIESTSEAYIAVRDLKGAHFIIKQKMTAEELHDYRQFQGAYFGTATQSHQLSNDPLEIFEHFMEMTRTWSREQVLKQLESHPNYNLFCTFSDNDVRLAWADSLLAVVLSHRTEAAACKHGKENA